MRANGDLYAKGWTQGRTDAVREAKAKLIRTIPETAVVIHNNQFLHIDDILDVLDNVNEGLTHVPAFKPPVRKRSENRAGHRDGTNG